MRINGQLLAALPFYGKNILHFSIINVWLGQVVSYSLIVLATILYKWFLYVFFTFARVSFYLLSLVHFVFGLFACVLISHIILQMFWNQLKREYVWIYFDWGSILNYDMILYSIMTWMIYGISFSKEQNIYRLQILQAQHRYHDYTCRWTFTSSLVTPLYLLDFLIKWSKLTSWLYTHTHLLNCNNTIVRSNNIYTNTTTHENIKS